MFIHIETIKMKIYVDGYFPPPSVRTSYENSRQLRGIQLWVS